MEVLDQAAECRWSLALEGLTESEHEQIAARMQRRRYGRRAQVFTYGDPSDAALIVESGRVRQFHSNHDGTEFTVEIWSGDHTMGLISAVLGCRRLVSAQTVEETTVLSLPRSDLLELMQSIPTFGVNIARLVASIASDCLTSWSPLALEPANLRLCKVLRKLGVPATEAPAGLVVSGLTQHDLASMVGVSRPWISLTLSTFEKEGLIWRRRSEIGIFDVKALERYCQATASRP